MWCASNAEYLLIEVISKMKCNGHIFVVFVFLLCGLNEKSSVSGLLDTTTAALRIVGGEFGNLVRTQKKQEKKADEAREKHRDMEKIAAEIVEMINGKSFIQKQSTHSLESFQSRLSLAYDEKTMTGIDVNTIQHSRSLESIQSLGEKHPQYLDEKSDTDLNSIGTQSNQLLDLRSQPAGLVKKFGSLLDYCLYSSSKL